MAIHNTSLAPHLEVLDIAGVGAGRLDQGGLGEDGEGNGGLRLGELRPRSIGISKAGLETGVWGLEIRDNTGDTGAGS